jgi:hypothetical protein
VYVRGHLPSEATPVTVARAFETDRPTFCDEKEINYPPVGRKSEERVS